MAKRPPPSPLPDAQLALFAEWPWRRPAAARAEAPPQPAAAPLRHPQANRDIVLAGQAVGYALRRARRRSIGFIVGADGLSVNAPGWVGIGDIEAALREKAAWILRKLAEQRDRQARLQSARVDWRDGTVIPFLGEPVVIVLDGAVSALRRGAVWLNTTAGVDAGATDAQRRSQNASPPALHTGLPAQAPAEQIRDTVRGWLQRQARLLFEQRCQHFAVQLGVRYTRLSLSSAQTRWGSASANGSIRLNWRLIHLPLATIDYVVAHELAHLREMNHSPRFWAVVSSVVPDYEAARRTLKSGVLPVFE